MSEQWLMICGFEGNVNSHCFTLVTTPNFQYVAKKEASNSQFGELAAFYKQVKILILLNSEPGRFVLGPTWIFLTLLHVLQSLALAIRADRKSKPGLLCPRKILQLDERCALIRDVKCVLNYYV